MSLAEKLRGKKAEMAQQEEAQKLQEQNERLAPIRAQITQIEDRKNGLNQLLEKMDTWDDVTRTDAKTALRPTKQVLVDLYNENRDVLQQENIGSLKRGANIDVAKKKHETDGEDFKTVENTLIDADEYKSDPEITNYTSAKEALRGQIADVKNERAAVYEALSLDPNDPEQKLSKEQLANKIKEVVKELDQNWVELKKLTPEGANIEMDRLKEKIREKGKDRPDRRIGNYISNMDSLADTKMLRSEDWEDATEYGMAPVKELVLEEWQNAVDQKTEKTLEDKGITKTMDGLKEIKTAVTEQLKEAQEAMRAMQESGNSLLRLLWSKADGDENLQKKLKQIGLPIENDTESANRFVTHFLKKNDYFKNAELTNLGTELDDFFNKGKNLAYDLNSNVPGNLKDLPNFQFVTDSAKALTEFFNQLKEIVNTQFDQFLGKNRDDLEEPLLAIGKDLEEKYIDPIWRSKRTRLMFPQDVDPQIQSIINAKGLNKALEEKTAEAEKYKQEGEELKEVLKLKIEGEITKKQLDNMESDRNAMTIVRKEKTLNEDKEFAREALKEIETFKIQNSEKLGESVTVSYREPRQKDDRAYFYDFPKLQEDIDKARDTVYGYNGYVKKGEKQRIPGSIELKKAEIEAKKQEKPAALSGIFGGKTAEDLKTELATLQGQLTNLESERTREDNEWSKLLNQRSELNRKLLDIVERKPEINHAVVDQEITIEQLLNHYSAELTKLEQATLKQEEQTVINQYKRAEEANKEAKTMYHEALKNFRERK